MKIIFFKKTIFLLGYLIIFFSIFVHPVNAAAKLVPKGNANCIQNSGECVPQSQAKDRKRVSGGEVLCSKGQVCVDKNISTKDEKMIPATNAKTDIKENVKVGSFCQDNPTKADILAGKLNSKTNSNLTYDSNVMSQEECQAWVTGTSKSYQEYVAKYDPQVNVEYEKILKDMKTAVNTAPEKDSILLSNLDKAIADVEKTITTQTNNIKSAISDITAPSKNGTTIPSPVIQPDSSSAGIMTADQYKYSCKWNNGLSADADVLSVGAKVVYSIDQPSCPAGYVETGLQYSITLKMHCCIRNESYFNNCLGKGNVTYVGDCSSPSFVSSKKQLNGSGIWTCCQATTVTQTDQSSVSATTITAYQSICGKKMGTATEGRFCTYGSVPEIGYNQDLNVSCCQGINTLSSYKLTCQQNLGKITTGKNCASGSVSGLGYSSFLNVSCCK